MTVKLQSVLLGHLADLFQPVTSISDVDKLRHLLDVIGWDLDALAGVDVTAVVTAAQSVSQATTKLVDVMMNGTGELPEFVEVAATLTAAVTEMLTVLKSWSPPSGLQAADLALLPADLVAELMDSFLRATAPRVAAVMDLLGVLRRVPAPEIARSDGVVVRRAKDRPEVDTVVLRRAVTDPWGLFADRFLKDAAGNRRLAEGIADIAGPLVAELLQSLGVLASYGVTGRGAGLGLTTDELGAARHMLLARYEIAASDDGAGINLRMGIGLTDDTGGRGLGIVLATSGELDLAAGPVHVVLAGQPGAMLVTESGVDFDPAVTGGLTLTVGYAPAVVPGEPVARFGSPTGTRLELGSIAVTLSGELAANSVDVGFTVALDQLLLAVSAGDGDGFLSKVLPTKPIEVTANLELDWSIRKGLKVRGGGGLEIEIAKGLVLGPITIDELVLAVAINEAGLNAQIAIGATLAIGPLLATVQRIGLRAALSPTTAADASALLAVGFKPPNGVGLAIDASVVSGGGFLSFDFDKQQYSGILQLSIQKVVDVKAIGILNARLPDGRPGYSLLLIITGEFPPIQLGMGFTLNGVGGLIAINRTVVVDVLRAGVRDGGLDAILFPPDPLSHVASLLGTLSAVFPVAEGRYVFGPMVRIGWGSPTLITLDLALILEIPDPVRLIILGRLKAVLPNEKAPVVQLRLDAIGVLDFSRNEFSLDATLYDSRIVTFALTGDMALRLSWGSQPAFAMALGGFHPAFKPPPGFPALRRLALALSTGDNPRLRMETYFALTSNTVQVGARLELYVKISAFSLEGGLGFDTLIQFSPFRLLADIDAHLALKRGSTTLMGLDINVHLMGPAPWVLWGQAKFKIFFVSFSIPFRATFGQSQDVPPIERREVWPILRDSLTATASWSAQLPGDSGRLVTVRADAGGDDLLAHPLGTLAVSQNLVPLERTLGLFGAVPPKDFDRFAIVAATGLDIIDTTTQYFAPAQFRQMTDAEKLASPSFERMVSGVRFAPHTAIAIGHIQDTPLDYEQAVILDVDQPASERLEQRYAPAGATVAVLAEHGPAGTAAVRTQGRAKFAPPAPGPKVADPSYVIVTRDDLTPVAVDGLDGSYTSAAERLRQRADRDALQIVRTEELELT